MTPPLRRQRSTATFFVLVGLAMAVALVFWLGAALPYFRMQRATFGPYPELFWPRRIPLLVHIVGGSLALLLGPIALWLGRTNRAMRIHRILGRLYGVGIGVGGGAAVYLALTTSVGAVYALGLGGMAAAWFVTTGSAIARIRRGDRASHQRWAVRSYVVTLSFVFFRAISLGLKAAGVGDDAVVGETLRATIAAWSSWMLPLAVTVLCQRGERAGNSRPLGLRAVPEAR